MPLRFRAAAPAVLVCALALSGCSDSGDDGDGSTGSGTGTDRSAAVAGGPADPVATGTTAPGRQDRLDVAASFYPLQFLAERIGGDAVQVEGLTAPGAEPHDLELSPKQVAALGEADLVLYLKGFQPAVDEAVEQQARGAALDAATASPLTSGYVPIEDGEAHEDEAGEDPHIWLDPTRYAAVGDAVAARLGQRSPERAAAFTANAAALRTELEALDRDYRSGLTGCARKEIVTSHNAFGYLAARYGLQQVALTGLTPEGEASPARLVEVARYAKEKNVTTIFFEELVSPANARSLASEVGAEAVALSPLEGPPETGDYLTQMRANLETLRTALGCAPA